MDVSVIICTYNRCESLRRTLETFCDVQVPPDLAWELLVVDNNSNDNTQAVCASFSARLPLRYLFEARQGKSVALNHAVVEATGALLLFTDDDVSVTGDWILNLQSAAQCHPEFAFFGGRVLPQWEAQPPRWFVENAGWLETNPHVDFGEQEREVTGSGRISFVGANFGVRKAVYDIGVRYREDVGPNGAPFGKCSRHGAEECELQGRLLACGLRGFICSAFGGLPSGSAVSHDGNIHPMVLQTTRGRRCAP